MKLNMNPFFLTADDIEWVQRTLSNLSTEEKVGQLFLLDLGENRTPDELLKKKPGGVHLFATGFGKSKEQQQALIRDMQNQSKVPLLFSGDLESGGQGGAEDGTNFATNMQLAAAADKKLGEAFGNGIEAEGTAMGFNWVFGPVVDINYNFQNPIVNIRAFGDSPQVVQDNALAVIKGVQQSNGMAACVKHWPGDGCDDRDQHKVMTVNSKSMKEWRATYGQVYKAAFNAGVKSVMTAHIALPAYYEELGESDVRKKYTPGSLSYELNTKLLREELGFNGLIVSDATSMTGMDSFGPRKDIVPLSIASGVDMFLFTNDLDFDYKAMLQGVAEGIITSERLDEAVTRILALKASLGLHKSTFEPKSLAFIGSEEHHQLAVKLAKKSVTLVKDTQRLLPIAPDKHRRVLLLAPTNEDLLFGGPIFNGNEFESMLRAEGFDVIREFELKEENNEVDVVIHLVKKSPGFFRSTVRMEPAEAGGLFKWYPTRIPTMFISLANPYTLYEMPVMPTVINAYNDTLIVQKEIVNAMLGRQPFLGTSPVDAFCGQPIARL